MKLRFLITVLFAATSIAVYALPRLSLTEADYQTLVKVHGTTEWFGCYVQDHKVGWSSTSIRPVQSGAEPAGLEVAYQAHIEIKADGQTMDMTSDRVFTFDSKPPFNLSKAADTTTVNGTVQHLTVVRSGTGFLLTDSQKPSQPKLIPAMTYTLGDECVNDLLLLKNTKEQEKFAYWSLNSDSTEFDESSAWISATNTAAIAGVSSILYEITYQSPQGEIHSELYMYGTLFKGTYQNIIEIRSETQASATSAAEAYDLFTKNVVKLDKPIRHTGSPLTRLSLLAKGPKANAIPNIPGQVTKTSGNETRVTIFSKNHSHPVTSPEEITDSLKVTRNFPADDPLVRKVAAEGVGDGLSIRQKALNLLHFTSDYIEDDPVMDSPTVQEALIRRKGDCSEHARVFVSLARAAGIPAREVSGLYYMGDYVKSFGLHAWVEVAIDGRWYMMDPIMDQEEIDAFHIVLSTPNDEIGYLATTRDLSFKLLSVK